MLPDEGYLEEGFDTVDLLPQDHISADVLRECLQSRDVELNTVDWFDGGEYIEGKCQGHPCISLSFPPC